MGQDCKSCETKDSVIDRKESGYMECMACGYSFGKIIDLSDVRYSQDTNGRTRGQSEVNSKIDALLPHVSMSSYLTGRGHHTVKQLQIWGRVPARERSLVTVFDIMQQKLQHTGLEGKIMDDAKIYYYKLFKAIETDEIQDEKKKKDVLSRGSNRDGLIAYCVQLSCEKHHVHMPDDRIADLFNITIPILKAGRKKFNQIVNEKNVYLDMYQTFFSTEDMLKKYMPSFPLTTKEQKLCILIAKRIEKLGLLKNKEPSSAAAGVLYFVSWLSKRANLPDMDKKKVAEVCQKSEPTVAKVFQVLLQNQEYITPKKKK